MTKAVLQRDSQYGLLVLVNPKVRDLFAQRIYSSVSEWADNNRYLSIMSSAEPGRWRTRRTPYLKEIMDCRSDPAVRRVSFKKPTQIGGTEVGLNIIGYNIDQDPAPTMYVLPRNEDRKSFVKTRIRPLLHESPSLKKHRAAATGASLEEFDFERMPFYLVGSNSPAGLAMKPVRDIIFDEVNKYPPFSGREADPISLGEERTKTYWNRFIFLASTPTTPHGYISQSYEESDKRQYYVPCPHCGRFQIFRWEQVKFQLAKFAAWYECEACEGRIDDHHKQVMLEAGLWVAEGEEIDGGEVREKKRTEHAGFQINAIYSPWLTFKDVAQKFFQAQKGGQAGLMNFRNSWLAEDWFIKTKEYEVIDLKKRAGGYLLGDVPRDVIILTAGVDVQQDMFYYVIRGWGVRSESWLIRNGIAYSWAELIDQVVMRQYRNNAADSFTVRFSCVDSGYKTDEVYDQCRLHPAVMVPIKGQRSLTQPIKQVYVDRTTSRMTKVSGLTLWHLDTEYFKNMIAGLLDNRVGEDGFWHLPDDVTDDYLQQFTSEHRPLEINRRTGRMESFWRPKVDGSPNHYWDCEVYACAAAEIIGARYIQTAETPKHRPDTAGTTWLNINKNGWIR